MISNNSKISVFLIICTASFRNKGPAAFETVKILVKNKALNEARKFTRAKGDCEAGIARFNCGTLKLTKSRRKGY